MAHSLIPADTSAEAARVQFGVLRKMGPGGRAKSMFELNDALRATMRAGVRNRHPEYTSEQVRLSLFRLTLGEDLFHDAFPGIEVRP